MDVSHKEQLLLTKGSEGFKGSLRKNNLKGKKKFPSLVGFEPWTSWSPSHHKTTATPLFSSFFKYVTYKILVNYWKHFSSITRTVQGKHLPNCLATRALVWILLATFYHHSKTHHERVKSNKGYLNTKVKPLVEKTLLICLHTQYES